MHTHWTYSDFTPEEDLRQGDIIDPSDGIRRLFREVHPHFCDEKYLAFMVLTQSCDLVRRNKPCKARYINLAVVRSLEGMLLDFLDATCDRVGPGIYTKETKRDAHQLLSRIFNQNEQALGVLYLHPDLEAGITVGAVALLRISVTVRAQHYDLLCQSRRGRLAPEFGSKLGWLVGNLYSRVGTPDWADTEGGREALEKLIGDYLDGLPASICPKWVRERDCRAAKAADVDVGNLPRDQVETVLARYRPPDPREQAIGRVCEVLRNVLPTVTDAQIEKTLKRLRNDRAFTAAFRR